MEPIEFEGCNVIYAKDQPEYIPLPAKKTEDGTVTTCWKLSADELAQIQETGRHCLSKILCSCLLVLHCFFHQLDNKINNRLEFGFFCAFGPLEIDQRRNDLAILFCDCGLF